mgnify:CR=1 FL=1
MKKIIISTIFISLLTACASQPEDIAATYVSPSQYRSYTCPELEIEMQDITKQVSLMTGTLEQKADTDAAQMGIGLFLLWPTLFFLDGDGTDAAKYSLLKGEYEAVNTSYKRKNCKNYVEEKDSEQTTSS